MRRPTDVFVPLPILQPLHHPLLPPNLPCLPLIPYPQDTQAGDYKSQFFLNIYSHENLARGSREPKSLDSSPRPPLAYFQAHREVGRSKGVGDVRINTSAKKLYGQSPRLSGLWPAPLPQGQG